MDWDGMGDDIGCKTNNIQKSSKQSDEVMFKLVTDI